MAEFWKSQPAFSKPEKAQKNFFLKIAQAGGKPEIFWFSIIFSDKWAN